MAGYITAMTTPLPPHVLADLHKACRYDPLAVSTIDKLISEITRVSEQIAAVAPACTDLAVAFNTQFLPADHVPQQPSGRGVASTTPPPSPCLPRLARQTLDAHSDIFTSMPSKDCRVISDTDVMDSTLFDTDASTISQETRSEDDGMSAIDDNLCSEYDALNNMLRKKFGDLPTMTGDPDTSVLVDVAMSQDFAAQDPLPRCKLPCSFGDWNPLTHDQSTDDQSCPQHAKFSPCEPTDDQPCPQRVQFTDDQSTDDQSCPQHASPQHTMLTGDQSAKPSDPCLQHAKFTDNLTADANDQCHDVDNQSAKLDDQLAKPCGQCLQHTKFTDDLATDVIDQCPAVDPPANDQSAKLTKRQKQRQRRAQRRLGPNS